MENKGKFLDQPATVNLDREGSLGTTEWLGLLVLAFTLLGWLTMPLHGINEAWIALAGLLVFLATGCLDRKSFKNNMDWGLIVFFGIVNSMAVVSDHLHVERWITSLVAPILTHFSFGPLSFLMIVVVVCFTRLFLRKAAAVVVLTVTFLPIARNVGIHPGVILLTILMASECFFLPYQDGPYQIAYSSTDGRAFSHLQARKILTAKMVATLVAIAVSVPYWRMLGFIN